MADYPVDKQSGVSTNRVLEYNFSQPVDLESIETGGGVLIDVRDNSLIDGVWSISADNLTVTFMPEIALVPNTSYTLTFAGEDDADTLPVTLIDTNPLPESVFITFMTGSGQDVPEQTVITEDGPADATIIEDGQTIEERVADVFAIESTTPVHMDSWVQVTTDTIEIKFSKALNPTQDWATLLTMKYSPLLRETYLFNDGDFKTHTRRAAPGMASELDATHDKFIIPTGTWALTDSDTKLVWTKDSEQPNFNANVFIHVSISGALASVDDEALNTSQDENFYFLTDLYPLLTTVESVLLPLSEIEGFISEEVVLRVMLDKSLEAWRLSGRKIDLIEPSAVAQRYVECASIAQLIDQKTIQKEINRGKSIKLAELSLDYNFPRSSDVSASTIRDECAEQAYDLKLQLAYLKGNTGVVKQHMKMPFDIYRNRMYPKSGWWFDPGQSINR